ncbi:MAG TPA: hypothetical protein VFB06_11240 [Streptosporangiaceae bacterium]|nr:hypothetical protein [Streptosporangiaceae bacterium]
MIRVLLAAMLAATGHAGASVLVAVLVIAARLARVLLPVLPQLAVAVPAVAIVLTGLLAFRAVKGWPHLAAVAG